MSYLTYQEAVSYTGLTFNKFADLVKSGQLKNTKIEGKKHLFLKSDLDNFKVFIPNLEDYYCLDEVSALLDIKKANIIQAYIPQGFFKDIVKHRNKFYIGKQKVDSLYNKHLSFLNSENMITSYEAATILNIQHDSVLNLISKGYFNNVIRDIHLLSKWKINLNEVLIMKEKKEEKIAKRELLEEEIENPYINNPEYVNIPDLMRHFSLSEFNIRTAIKKGIFNTHVRFNKLHYVKKSEMLSMSNLEELLYTPYELFLKRKDNLNELLPFLLTLNNKDLILNTIHLFYNFFKLRSSTNGYKNKSVYERNLVFSFVQIAPFLNKEIYNHSDSEIEHLLNLKEVNNTIKKHIVSFLNYVSNEVDNCEYTNKYNFSAKPNRSLSKEIYSKEEYFKVYSYVENIELHKRKAIANKKYASAWFYVLVHLCNAWRSSDILDFPTIEELREVVPTNQFLINENLSLEDSQLIINIVQNNWERFFIHKTGGLNKFHVNLSLVIPMATAISILMNKNSERFLSLSASTVKSHTNSFFKEIEFNFSSLKMNRSFLTYFFENVSSGKNNADISNLLTTKLRGHKDEDTIQNYVMNTNEDGFSDNISYNLFRRGHFGWLYHSLVDIVSNQKELNFEEKTLLIETYQKIYSPKEIEYLSEFFLLQQNKNKSIAMEIAMLPNEELKNKLMHIFKGKMPSKELDSQCLFSSNCKNPSGDCFTCPYIVPRVYLLSSLKNEINRVIDELFSLKEHETIDRMKISFLLFKLLNLLQQSVETYGKEYVNSYLDLKSLQFKLESINSKILIQNIRKAGD